MIALARLLLFALALVALAITPSTPALAQGADLDLSAQVSSRQVEVGEPFTVELKALTEGGSAAASDPELRAPTGFTISGPSVSTRSYMQFGTGGSSVKTGIGATWQLVASAPGSYVIPAPSVRFQGKRVRANTMQIEVVPATGRPRRPQSPFLFPGGPSFGFPWPFGNSDPADDEPDEEEPSGNSALAMPTVPDANLFLRAMVDKKSAVVGEQVTISFYIYHRVDFEMTERREAPLSDFVRVPLLKNPGTDPAVVAVAGGRRYAVRLLDKIAVFPVRAGDLHTGSMGARVTGRRIGSRVLKQSDDLVIHVTEPPKEGRPPGYTLGDVGQFSLSSSVQPRRIDQGGSVAVTLRVQGTGNFPQSLRIPQRTGVEWLDPEKREAIEPQAGQIGGWRTFGYVVRVKESGTVDLGAVELPYWDPVAKRYEVARAELGTVEAQPAAPSPSASGQPGAPSAAPEADDAKSDPFTAIPGVRTTLGAYTPPAPPLLAGARFWWLLAAPPLLFGLFSAGTRASRAISERRAADKTSPVTLAERALRDAEQAEARGDAKELAAALERALHHAIEHATDLRARGVLLGELPGELEKRGLEPDLAARVGEALGACETIRFDPAATPSAIHELRARAQSITRDLARRKAA